MKRLIIFVGIIAFVKAGLYYPLDEVEHLDYPYGVGEGSVTRQEIRTPDGRIRGTYVFVNGDGTSKTISYGDRYEVATPEVQEEQQISNEDIANAKLNGNTNKEVDLPEPVPYTTEVAAARAAHFAAREHAVYLQQLVNQPIMDYPSFFSDYYGAANHLRTRNSLYVS